jgi:hypothetical protein
VLQAPLPVLQQVPLQWWLQAPLQVLLQVPLPGWPLGWLPWLRPGPLHA